MKVMLEEEHVELTNELKTIGIHNPEIKEDWIATPDNEDSENADPNVVADRVEDWEERRATLSTFERQYNNVNRALEKIKSGAYGVCEINGEEIEEDRLLVNPSARTCREHMEDEAQLP